MMLFTKDPKEIGDIASLLRNCGCCARCTLRYLGLKDTYAYRKSLQEMNDEVEKLLRNGNMEESTSGTEELNEGQTVKDVSDLNDIGSSLSRDSGINHNSLDGIKTDQTELSMENANYLELDVGKTSSVTSEDKRKNTDELEIETGKDKADLTKSSARETDISKSESNAHHDKTQSFVRKTDDMVSNTTQLDTGTDSAKENAMDTGEGEKRTNVPVPTQKENCHKKELPTQKQVDSQKPCIACLGILDEFTTEEFLHKIKVASIDEDFEFSSYICSLMIPVSIILREHALMLFLKDKYGNVYDNVKFLDIPTIKDVWKWRNGPELKELLGAPFDQKSSFDITLNFIYKDSDRECSFLVTYVYPSPDNDLTKESWICIAFTAKYKIEVNAPLIPEASQMCGRLSLMSDTFRKRKQDRRHNKKGAFQLYNRANVTKAVLEMSTKEFKSHFQCPPKVPNSRCTCEIKCQNEAMFIAGRYNKYSRTLSQTPWIIEGQRKSESSVEELICTEIDKAFKPTEHKFSSAGREDVDVLMLGDGRPFIVELTNPRRVSVTQEEMTSIQTKANNATKDIKIRDLQIVSREETEKLKEGEIDKIKNYLAQCWSKSPLSIEDLNKLTQIKDLKILQKTPIRVLHRRPLSTREKCIHSMTVQKVDDYHFSLGLKTQAGTYIKEFVHGDFGRTKPNLTALLGVECDILELDVESVELDWPKKIE